MEEQQTSQEQPIKQEYEPTRRSVYFYVEGKPQPKQRPRFYTRGKFAKAYTPSETVTYENLVRFCYKKQLGDIFFRGPIKVKIEIVVAIEKKHFGKKGLNKEGEEKYKNHIPPVKKPDLDNVAKSILDALNEVAWHDDCQIVQLTCTKRYSQSNRNTNYTKIYISDF